MNLPPVWIVGRSCQRWAPIPGHLRISAVATMSSKVSEKNASAQQTLDSEFGRTVFDPVLMKSVLYEMSQLLGTQLNKETLATCVGLIESGVNPDALAVCHPTFVFW
jgi:mitotic-spindle organizing protein 1